MITKAPQRFNVKPSEAIVCIEKRPVPKVTALGGVATGNIKAKEALIAAGIMTVSYTHLTLPTSIQV